MTTNPSAILEVQGPQATLTLNRPEQRNALSTDLLDALHQRLDELEPLMNDAGSRPRVLTITGAGKAFCAGMDLKQVIIDADHGGSGDPALGHRLLSALARLTLRLRSLPCVVLAKVNGPAVGGGCGMLCVADLAVTHAENKVGFPEVDLGLCPAVVAPWLVHKVGPGRARRVLLAGGVMTGAEAHRLGIIDMLADTPATLDELAGDLQTRLASGGPLALEATKSLLNDLDGSVQPELLDRAARLSADVLATPPAQAQLISRLGR